LSTTKISFAAAFALTALAVLLLATGGEAETLVVDAGGNGDFTTLGAALGNASADDIIRVWNGTYHEQVVVDRNVMLVGNGSAGTIIDANLSTAPPDGGTVVNITADGVTLQGFTVTGGRHGVMLYRVAGCLVRDNNLSGNYVDGFHDTGLYLIEAAQNTLLHNRLTDNQVGIRLRRSHDNLVSGNNASYNRNFGIKVADSHHEIISQNRVNNNEYNIYLERCHNVTVNENNASYDYNHFFHSNGDYPIYAHSTNNSTFTGNRLNFAIYGLMLELSNNNIVTGNKCEEVAFSFIAIQSRSNLFSHNWVKYGGWGFYLENARYNHFIDNRVDQAGGGLRVDESNQNLVRGNLFINVTNGIVLNNSSDNDITKNEFRNTYAAISILHSTDNRIDDNTFIDSEAFDIYESWVDIWPPSPYREPGQPVDETEVASSPEGTVIVAAALAVVGSLMAPVSYLYFLRRR